MSPRASHLRLYDAVVSSPDGPLADPALVAAIRAGDVVAFEAFVRTYYADLVRFAESIVRNGDVAEDLVCEIFTRVWIRRAEWTPHTTAIAYVMAAVRNEALRWLRTQAQRTTAAPRVEAAADRWLASREMPDAGVLDAEMAARVRALLGTLPEQDRTAITLRWLYELAFDEIAQVMGTTSAAVQMRLSRALKALRRSVSPEP